MAEYYRKLLVDETDYLNNRIVKFNQTLDTLTGDNVDSPSPAASHEFIESGLLSFPRFITYSITSTR